MLIRKNTKAFKTIKEIIVSCKDRSDRQQLIRLYITKAGHSVNDRISVEALQGDSDLFYELNYDAVLNNLESSNRQLHQSDDLSGLYYFNQASNKLWDETPFEFDTAIHKEFALLSDLPVGRKKEKQKKFVFPVRGKVASKPDKKEKSKTNKAAKAVNHVTWQPDYKLDHKILFTELDKVVFKKPALTKKEVLDYYDKIAGYLLPFLKDRWLSVRLFASHSAEEYNTLAALAEVVEVPDWIQSANRAKKKENSLLCNNKDHLLWYVEIGAIEFCCAPARIQSVHDADYIIIEMESPETQFEKAIDVALVANQILSGLHLPSFVKTDGRSLLHIYLPVDSTTKFETSQAIAKYICQLIQLKVPEQVTLEGEGGTTYGKVALNYLINDPEKRVVVPYSLVTEDSPVVAAPLRWEEVKEGLRLQDINHETVFKRIGQAGDPFASFSKRKINAAALLERLEDNYSFLF